MARRQQCYVADMSQLSLFGTPTPADPADADPDFKQEHALARRMPSHVRFGTSSWTFSGWCGLVYPANTTLKQLREHGLSLYCRNPLFQTVGIDSSFYRPLEASQLKRYRDQLPKGFRCVSKVFGELTTRTHPKTLENNPHFLQPERFERDVLRPIAREFSEHQGPLVFEFPANQYAEFLGGDAFAALLEAFFKNITREFDYAIELREKHLICPRYVDVLHRFGVGHVFNFWQRMPTLSEQLSAVGTEAARFGVVRLLIPPGKSYSERKRELSPFNRIVEIQPEMRDDVASMVREFAKSNRRLFVLVNNKAEGSSPLTVRALAERVAR